PAAKPQYNDEIRVTEYARKNIGTSWATREDTKSNCFRIQNDTDGFFTQQRWCPQNANGDPTPIDDYALYLSTILSMQPYTDEKGYELATPFPWGRWKDLNTALRESRLSNFAGMTVKSTDSSTI